MCLVNNIINQIHKKIIYVLVRNNIYFIEERRFLSQETILLQPSQKVKFEYGNIDLLSQWVVYVYFDRHTQLKS